MIALPEGDRRRRRSRPCWSDLAGRFPGHVYLAGQHLYRGDDGGAWPGWRPWPRARARRWSPSTMSMPMFPRAGRCRMC